MTHFMSAPHVWTLLLFFVGVGLCLLRAPQGDRWHAALCAAAGLLWGVLPVVDPSTRTSGFGFTTTFLLALALSQFARRRSRMND